MPEPITEEETETIIKMAKCLSMVCIEEMRRDGSKKTFWGTAFFISETRLLTAAHNVEGSQDKNTTIKIRVSAPGLSVVSPFKLARKQMQSIECDVVERIYHPVDDLGNYMDIAILDSGSHLVPEDQWLALTSKVPSPKSTISVIGYPGAIQLAWVTDHGGLTDDDFKARGDAEALLPTGHLTLSRGVCRESLQHIIRYNISTCPGMSGGCVLLDGKAIGMARMVVLMKAFISVNPIKIQALCQWRRHLPEMSSRFFGDIMSFIDFSLSRSFEICCLISLENSIVCEDTE